jgi:uncharacterized protein YndB with AHSA1/START domain
MEPKTKVHAEDGKQELTITREFDLPVELLFKAHTEPELLEEWMGSKVLKLDARKHGSWQLEKRNEQGIVVFGANGVFHDFVQNEKFTRTFEMENTPFDVQLEFFEFEKLAEDTSRLTMHIVYRSVELRDQVLKMPFAAGINMAHNRLEEVIKESFRLIN